MTTILSDLNQFHKFLKSPPHHAYIATQPCKILMSAKQAINDKLQGSVATQARCGGIFNIQLQIYPASEKLLKSVKI